MEVKDGRNCMTGLLEDNLELPNMPDTSSTDAQSRMKGLWPDLELDEKRFLLVRPLYRYDANAARQIDKNERWLDKVIDVSDLKTP